jgi:ammonia channel protein AmtB
LKLSFTRNKLTKTRVCFQWLFWGYSLAYSRSASPFIGNMEYFGLKNVMSAPSPGSALLPEIVFCFYQMLFCACTVQLVIGGSFERGRIMPSMIFAFCWATIVYCPIACWTWNANGWLFNLPSLDFAVCFTFGSSFCCGLIADISKGWRSSSHCIRLVCSCLRIRSRKAPAQGRQNPQSCP